MTRDMQLYIDGEFTDGTGNDVYEVTSPVTGEHIANIPVASPADIDRAVAAARRATEEMRHWTAFERAELCLRIYEIVAGPGGRHRPHPDHGAGQALQGRGHRRHRRVGRLLPDRRRGRQAALGAS
jgi:hypothetical protein